MKRSAYAKLLGLAVLEIVLLTAFLVPMQVKLDMPSGTSPHAVEAARDWVPLFSITTAAIITISIFGDSDLAGRSYRPPRTCDRQHSCQLFVSRAYLPI